jgi:hypothetical protein
VANPTQNYSNHQRYLPYFHFFVLPILGANFVISAVRLFRDPSFDTTWTMLVALALVLGIFAARAMPLRAQDRVIRLEERNRLAALLPADLKNRLDDLTTSQLIALRFAPDDEVPELSRRALSGELRTAAEIKRAVKNWRADHLRV